MVTHRNGNKPKKGGIIYNQSKHGIAVYSDKKLIDLDSFLINNNISLRGQERKIIFDPFIHASTFKTNVNKNIYFFLYITQ